MTEARVPTGAARICKRKRWVQLICAKIRMLLWNDAHVILCEQQAACASFVAQQEWGEGGGGGQEQMLTTTSLLVHGVWLNSHARHSRHDCVGHLDRVEKRRRDVATVLLRDAVRRSCSGHVAEPPRRRAERREQELHVGHLLLRVIKLVRR
jgi:hypothetical protein